MDKNNGMFIPLYDLDSLKLYLENGTYGFLMNPLYEEKPNPRSSYFQVLADYGCAREGTYIFFFIERKIIYGGRIVGNTDTASFYINGLNSPLGRKTNSSLIWDETNRYEKSENAGAFILNKKDGTSIKRAQPFIIKFQTDENTGRYIISDELYFELGMFPYPLPSNTIQKMGFCTLTPGEVEIAYKLIMKSDKRIDLTGCEKLKEASKEIDNNLFNKELISVDYMNESELEFNIVSDYPDILDFTKNKNFCVCRQVPISPFKPENIDRADVCLYDLDSPIKKGTIPNVLIELKDEPATFHAYEQVDRYLKWLNKNTSKEEFDKIQAYIVAPRFTCTKKKILDKNLSEFIDKIKLFSLDENRLMELDEIGKK